MKQDSLLSVVKLLEENGFHVTRAYEENNKDAGNVDSFQSMPTGAICLRVEPKKRDADEH